MERRKDSRLSVELPGSYELAGQQVQNMFFSQLSPTGCRLQAENLAATIGDTVELFLGPIGPIAGTVRWVDENRTGVEFATALDTALVSYFAAFIDDVA